MHTVQGLSETSGFDSRRKNRCVAHSRPRRQPPTPDLYEERRGWSPILVAVPLLVGIAGWLIKGLPLPGLYIALPDRRRHVGLRLRPEAVRPKGIPTPGTFRARLHKLMMFNEDWPAEVVRTVRGWRLDEARLEAAVDAYTHNVKVEYHDLDRWEARHGRRDRPDT